MTVSIWWCLLCLLAGTALGYFLFALMVMAARSDPDDNEKQEWRL